MARGAELPSRWTCLTRVVVVPAECAGETIPEKERGDDDADENFAAGGFRGPLNRYRNSERDFHDLPLMGVARVKQPSCFIAGAKDVVRSFVPGRDGYEKVDELCDDLRICKIVEGVGHWVQQEAPKEVNGALLEFLNSLT